MRNKIRNLLLEKKTFLGSTLMLGSTRVAEVMSRAGFDFLMIDLQHGPFDKMSATDAIRAVAASETTPFARVSENTAGAVNDVLDAGALGIVVPMINSAEEASAAVRAGFYPPKGQRSKGGSATAIYGDNYGAWANAETLVTVMIETAQAVDRAEQILATPGVDMCLLGTSDLALDLNCARDGEPIRQAMAKVIAAGTKRDVAVGTAIGTVADIGKWRDLGPSFYLMSHDQGLLKDASRRMVSELKQAVGR
jgi:4-hydroxy-2-oxoheptanedioate aldolase